MDGEDALVRRIVDAAVLPALLAREGVTALLEACDAQAAVVFVQATSGQVKVASSAGCDPSRARELAIGATRALAAGATATVPIEPLGRDPDGPRFALVSSPRTVLGQCRAQRFRTLCAVLRQGFDLCAARDRRRRGARRRSRTAARAAAAGIRLRQRRDAARGRADSADAGQRPHGAHHRRERHGQGSRRAGDPRRIATGAAACSFPTTARARRRELADSQLFGHRRGSFTGAIADQPGVLRTALGGTLFLDEVGDLPLDVQPKLLRFLEQGEVLPVGDTRPQRVDVRVVAATNADLEQRVADGKFREDLFYRLSVIRVHVPPLRDRREEIPHLSTFFLREASERLGKPGVRLSPETLDLFDAFPWPGNVRQLRNEVQRAVAMALPGGLIGPDLLSPVFAASVEKPADGAHRFSGRRTSLASAVESLEREMIEGALERADGNISETARFLGLTRRGLYLKMQRLGVSAARV